MKTYTVTLTNLELAKLSRKLTFGLHYSAGKPKNGLNALIFIAPESLGGRKTEPAMEKLEPKKTFENNHRKGGLWYGYAPEQLDVVTWSPRKNKQNFACSIVATKRGKNEWEVVYTPPNSSRGKYYSILSSVTLKLDPLEYLILKLRKAAGKKKTAKQRKKFADQCLSKLAKAMLGDKPLNDPFSVLPERAAKKVNMIPLDTLRDILVPFVPAKDEEAEAAEEEATAA